MKQLLLLSVVMLSGTAWTQVNTLSAPTFIKTLNNIQKCDQFAGATFDVKMNACITTVIAQGGGTADATGLIGPQSGTMEIDCGNASSVPVTCQLSPYLVYNFTSAKAGACAFKVFDGSRLIGTIVGITHQAIITNTTSTTATGSMVCTDYTAGTGEYVTIQGLQLYNPGNPNNANFTNGAVFIKNTLDGSTFRDLMIANAGGIGLHVEATCCATSFTNIVTDGSHVAGSVPLQIDSLTGDLVPVLGLMFYGLSADHPGPGKNNIAVKHTYTSALQPCSVSFFGVYEEGNNTDTTTPLNKIDSCALTVWNHVSAQFQSSSSTAVAFNVVNTSVPGINPIINLQGFQLVNSPQTLPAVMLTDNYRGASAVTDGQGTLVSYNGGDTESQFQQIGLFGYERFGLTSAPSAATDVRCYGDATLAMQRCNYNNSFSGAFFPVPLTGNVSGTHSDSGFFQTASAAGCTTAASIGAVCATPVTVTWPTAFADANYKITCQGSGAITNFPIIGSVTARVAANATVQTMALTAAAASFARIECIAVHN